MTMRIKGKCVVLVISTLIGLTPGSTSAQTATPCDPGWKVALLGGCERDAGQRRNPALGWPRAAGAIPGALKLGGPRAPGAIPGTQKLGTTQP
jgi:hypothetical protein